MKMLELCEQNKFPFEFTWSWATGQGCGRWFAIRIEGNELVTRNEEGKEVKISIDPNNAHHERNDDYTLVEKEEA